MPDGSPAGALGRRVLIADTRLETREIAQHVEAALLARGYGVQMLGAAAQKTEGQQDNEARPSGRLKGLLFGSLLIRSVALALRIAFERSRLAASLETIEPVAIIIFDDRPLMPNYVLRMLALGRNMPVVLIPFAVSTLESDVKLREDKPAHQLGRGPGRWLKSLIARWWPNQTHVESGAGFLFHNVWDTAALIFCGMLPQNPWYVGGSRPELVCAAGADQRAYFLQAGLSEDRIVLTGLPSLDELAESGKTAEVLRRALIAKYDLTGERALVVCAVPQYAEHGYLDWESHKKLTLELFETLAGSGANVLLSLHPKSQRSSYEEQAAACGLPILDERLAEILAAADLLVGTFSSTVGWAVGLGIPAFVAATIHSDYQLYRDMPGVVVVEDHAALAGVLSRFVRDQDFRTGLSAAAKQGANRVGRLDGRASERVASAIDQIVGSRVNMLVSGNSNVR